MSNLQALGYETNPSLLLLTIQPVIHIPGEPDTASLYAVWRVQLFTLASPLHSWTRHDCHVCSPLHASHNKLPVPLPPALVQHEYLILQSLLLFSPCRLSQISPPSCRAKKVSIMNWGEQRSPGQQLQMSKLNELLGLPQALWIRTKLCFPTIYWLHF